MAHRSIIVPILAVALVACGREGPAPVAPVTAPQAPEVTQPPAPAPEDATAPPPPSASEPELPRECSELIASYERCIEDHMPEVGRALLREALAKSREQWRQAAIDANTPVTRRQLAAACQQSKAELQTQMSGYGCIL